MGNEAAIGSSIHPSLREADSQTGCATKEHATMTPVRYAVLLVALGAIALALIIWIYGL
jgi:hypothetical protein